MSLWFKHDAHFHEHPKCLRLRRLAGSKADSAELGWWRIIAAAKRIGRWTFTDEEHLEDAAGRYYRYVPLYRQVGLLDGLTVHDGEEYQGPLSGAERVSRHRARNASSVTQAVTHVTPRETDKSRAERETDADGRDDLEAFLEVRRRPPSEKQRRILDEVLDRHDVTGPAWSAAIIRANPDDPIGAVIAADKQWKAERLTEANKVEREHNRRKKSSPQWLEDFKSYMAAADEKPAA